MYNLTSIMKRAWEIKKEQKDNLFCFCLKMAWQEAKNPSKEMRNYEIKDWFLKKNFTQNERYVIQCAIMGEELKILKKTEKAIQFKANSDYGFLTFWCPKSCLVENQTEQEKKWERERQNKFTSGLDYNHKLVEFAKENGIKGVHIGMKTLTLKQKISSAGFTIPKKEPQL